MLCDFLTSPEFRRALLQCDGDVKKRCCVSASRRGDFASSPAHLLLAISMLLALAVVAVCAAAPLFLDSVTWVLESIDGRFLLDG